MFYLAVSLGTSGPQDSYSKSSEGVLQRGKGRARILQGFCNKGQVF